LSQSSFLFHDPPSTETYTLSLHDALPIYLQEYSFFGQDEWRMRNDLTFNAGLRYDLDLIAQPSTLNPSASLAAAGIERRGLSDRSEEHTSELQSRGHLVCRLLLEKKKKRT